MDNWLGQNLLVTKFGEVKESKGPNYNVSDGCLFVGILYEKLEFHGDGHCLNKKSLIIIKERA